MLAVALQLQPPPELVVGVAGDAGVVEDQQPAGSVAGGKPGDVRGQLTLRRAGEAAVGVAGQGDGHGPEALLACRSSPARARRRLAPVSFRVDASPRV